MCAQKGQRLKFSCGGQPAGLHLRGPGIYARGRIWSGYICSIIWPQAHSSMCIVHFNLINVEKQLWQTEALSAAVSSVRAQQASRSLMASAVNFLLMERWGAVSPLFEPVGFLLAESSQLVITRGDQLYQRSLISPLSNRSPEAQLLYRLYSLLAMRPS